jgi:hypothetical protein
MINLHHYISQCVVHAGHRDPMSKSQAILSSLGAY